MDNFYNTQVQSVLDRFVEQDIYGFLKGVNSWSNHRPLLRLALCLTNGSTYMGNANDPVLEFGAGNGSTPFLKKYCQDNNRDFYSYDSNKEWADKCGSIHIDDWNKNEHIFTRCSVAFVDEAPGEHRHKSLALLAYKAQIIVVHDTEEAGAGNYMFDLVWPLFKKRINYNRLGGGAGATLLSNFINLDGLDGCNIGGFELEKKK